MSNTGVVSDIAILFITTFVIKNNYGQNNHFYNKYTQH